MQVLNGNAALDLDYDDSYISIGTDQTPFATEKVDSSLPDSTTPESSDSVRNYFGVIVGENTEVVATPGIRYIKTLSPKINDDILPAPKPQHSLSGSVIEVHDKSVRCEIYTNADNIFIALPIAIFPPDAIRTGLPFSLTLDDSSGYRKPVISIRDPNPEIAKDGLEEIEALIQDL